MASREFSSAQTPASPPGLATMGPDGQSLPPSSPARGVVGEAEMAGESGFGHVAGRAVVGYRCWR